MNDASKAILQVMAEARKLCEQVARLLGSADQIVAKHVVKEQHWECPKGNQTTGGNSESLLRAKYWIPEYYFRMYTNDGCPGILLYVAVILDNREDNKRYPPNGSAEFEPIVTAGYFDYGQTTDGRLWPQRCRWHVYSEDDAYAGKVFETRPTKDWPENERDFLVLRSLAKPLVSVKDSTELETVVVQPILDDLDGHTRPKGGPS